ncbi:MAG: hypothetical protein Q7K43_06780, partial [Candidatus Woesearchaeota archaeon]|nr:hypothetical protein [Candidatus Woesearchaeota archaeon]
MITAVKPNEFIKNIQMIYKELVIPKNLQMHMICTAGIASFIHEHWKGKSINKENIVIAMLLHDVGNIVKFDFSRKELYEQDVLSNVEFWKQRQKEFI